MTWNSTRDRLKQHSAIILLVLVYSGLATLYSLLIPLGEGPDEPGHARYVFFLAREGRLPVQCVPPCASDVPGEGHQPPLAYLLATPLLGWLAVEERDFDLPGNTRFTWAGGSELNAVAHGSREFWPWQGFVLGWHLARLVSMVLGIATVCFTYAAARALELQAGASKPRCAVLAAALVALNPQFLFISALVTNDALLTMLCAVFLFLLLKPATEQRTQQRFGRALALGVTLGLALITKQSALLLIPIAFLWCVLREADGKRIGFQFAPLAHIATRIVVVFGVAALIAGWWYIRNWQLYGDPLAAAVFQAEFMTQPFAAGNPLAWFNALAQLHSSFWARFGWMNLHPPDWVIWIFTVIELIALVGLFRLGRPALHNGRWGLLVLPLLACAWVVSFAFTAGLVAWQGRLLFPALPAIAILLARGLAAWDSPRAAVQKPRVSYLNNLVTGCLFVLALWLPFGVITPAYPPQTLPEGVALTRIATPVYARFARSDEPGAELRSVHANEVLHPGEQLDVTLLWHALGRQNRAWTVFIHLVNADETIVAEDNREPRNNAFPMSQWVAGDWVEDAHMLELPTTLAPGTYRLWVGLYYPPTNRRAGVYDAHGKPLGDYFEVRQFVVE